jgi:hypothetical protein
VGTGSVDASTFSLDVPAPWTKLSLDSQIEVSSGVTYAIVLLGAGVTVAGGYPYVMWRAYASDAYQRDPATTGSWAVFGTSAWHMNFQIYETVPPTYKYYVSDRTAGKVRIVNDNGVALTESSVVSADIAYPLGMCYDPADGHIWVTSYSGGIRLRKVHKTNLTTIKDSALGSVGANSCQGNPVIANGNIYCPHQNNSNTQNFAKYNIASDSWTTYIAWSKFTGCYGSALSLDGKYIYVGLYISSGTTTPRFARFNIAADAFDAYYGEIAGTGYIPGSFALDTAPDGTVIFGCGTQFVSLQRGWNTTTDAAVYDQTSLGIRQVYALDYVSGTTMIAAGSAPGDNIVAFNYQTGVLTSAAFASPSINSIGRSLINETDIALGGPAGTDEEADGSYNFRVFTASLTSPRKLNVASGTTISGILSEQIRATSVCEYAFAGVSGGTHKVWNVTDDGTTLVKKNEIVNTHGVANYADSCITATSTHIYYCYYNSTGGNHGAIVALDKASNEFVQFGGNPYHDFNAATEMWIPIDIAYYGGYLFIRVVQGDYSIHYLKVDPATMTVLVDTPAGISNYGNAYQTGGVTLDGKLYCMNRTTTSTSSWYLTIWDYTTNTLIERPSTMVSSWSGGGGAVCVAGINSTGTTLLYSTNFNSTSTTGLYKIDIATGNQLAQVNVLSRIQGIYNIDDINFATSGRVGTYSEYLGRWSDLGQVRTYDLDFLANSTMDTGGLNPHNEITRLSPSEADSSAVTANIRVFDNGLTGYTRYINVGTVVTTSAVHIADTFVAPWIERISAMTLSSTFSDATEQMNVPTLSGDWDGDHAIALTIADNSISGSITLDWNHVDPYEDLTIYEIYRSKDGSAFSLVHTTAAGIITWEDTGLTPGTYQYYGVPTRPDYPATAPASNTTTDVLASPIQHYDVIRTQVNGETPPSSYSYTTVTDALTWTSASQLYDDLSAGIIATELTSELYRYYQVRGDDGSTQTSWSNAITTQITMGPFDANAMGGHSDITKI